jgi:AraC family transcriptional activator of pobA
MRKHDYTNDQHLELMNSREYSRNLKVSLVTFSPPCENHRPHKGHVHPYWQLEIIQTDDLSLSFENMELTPKNGDILIIPPGNWHLYNYNNGARNTWAFKFAIENFQETLPPAIAHKTKEIEDLKQFMLKIIHGFQNGMEKREKYVLLEHLLACLVDLHYFAESPKENEPAFLRETRKLLKSSPGLNIEAAQAAARLGYSPAHLSRLFKKELGLSLKEFIDQERFVVAKNLLIYTDMNISEVAEKMDFHDVFRFSRFFKRLSGDSPREFLKKLRSQY